ncbi:hypothetical protein CHLNCDRAFT_138923 [Chlorella variabilis]|uniref:DUF4281 domain-containing protein n=1 Tax=Chlorella variabilis TaxID=554065 RepID=E1ZNY3_CHLVA|nr:hypothetical protein CHLNCDRAFT_138923 [Chlorella variabilis]EFN52519.1 hypothetical protein CHLNCDRAFT_138923 [Chlorella variabilis]|eukprot:XP_005844621.1 hypothetical protein CHLNCDRAFT_138923 [Chlorella variabilis]
MPCFPMRLCPATSSASTSSSSRCTSKSNASSDDLLAALEAFDFDVHQLEDDVQAELVAGHGHAGRMPIVGLPFTDAQLFQLQYLVMPAWVSLWVAPRWKHTLPLVKATATFYLTLWVLLTATAICKGGIVLDFWTYQGVFNLLTKENIVLPVWVHTLVFDLWRILAIPLVTTFYLGPAGLFVYLLAVRPFYPLLTGVKED